MDFTPPSPDDLPSIGHLIFDDRTSSPAGQSSQTVGNTTTTTTFKSSVPGETKGAFMQFKTSIGITMDGALVSDKDMANTFDHEAGHSAGLMHPWELSSGEKQLVPQLDQNGQPPAQIKIVKDNLMNSTENPDPAYNGNSGKTIFFGQLFSMFKNIAEKSNYTPKELKPQTNGNTPKSTP